MKLLWLFLWRWSWLLTVPCCAFLLVWLLQFAQRYAAFQLRYDVSPYRFGWGLEGGKHASRLWRELQLSLQPHSIDRSLRTVQLFVGADALAQLDNDLPHSGFEPVPGRLLNDGKFLPVEVRYRGDFLVHWAYDKKSLRVKLGKNDSYLGLRTFNLIAPKFDGQVNDLLGYVLARHLGVLAPRAELVWLQLNGRFCGLYTLVEQLGEGTLRDNDRMPGDLFVGELVAKDSWQGVDSNLFEHPGLWTKAAVDARLPAVARRPLQLLCELVNSPASEQVHAQLAALLDLQALGRMAALEILIGFFHTGENHNWRLYWDPARSRFEPIVWDLCAFGAFGMYGVFDQLGPTPVSLDPNADRLHNLLLGNAWFLAARQAALRRFLEGDGRELFRGELTRAIAAAALAAQQDPLLWPPDPAVVRAVLARLPAHVERVFDTVAHAYLQTGTPVQWQRLPRGVRITVADRVPVTGLVLHFAAKPASVVAELQIARTGETLRRRLGATAAGDRSIRLATGLHAQLQPAPTVELGYFKVGSHRVLPSSYDIELNGLAADAGLLAVDAERASGSVEPAQLATDLPSPQLDLLYGVGADEPQATTSWAGIVRVTEAQELRGDLVLAPGTEVRMAAGASLLLHGRLLALGTAEQPIRFVPAAEGQPPWGTVALLGPGAAGSQLRHCQWSGGSERSSPEGLFAFRGMVSIHDVAGVDFEHCTFERARVVGQMVHAVYSELTLSDCTFGDCTGDALALDISRALLRGCTFGKVGRHGARLMNAKVVLDACRFDGCGQQGIDASADSRLLGLGLECRACAVAVLARDGALVLLHAARLVHCGKALLARHQDRLHPVGGRIEAWDSTLADNQAQASADARSHIAIHGGTAQPPLVASSSVQVATDAGLAAPVLLPEFDARARQLWAERAVPRH